MVYVPAAVWRAVTGTFENPEGLMRLEALAAIRLLAGSDDPRGLDAGVPSTGQELRGEAPPGRKGVDMGPKLGSNTELGEILKRRFDGE